MKNSYGNRVSDYLIQIKFQYCNGCKIGIILFSAFYAISLTFGSFIYYYNSIAYAVSSFAVLFTTLFYSAIIFLITYIITSFLFCVFAIIDRNSEITPVFSYRKLFFFWGFIFVCWIPCFLTYYPGMYTYDIWFQDEEVLAKQITMFHPPIHTAFWKICLLINNITELNTLSVYSVLQMLILAFCMAYLLTYFASKNINKSVIIVSLLFFSLNPIIAMMSMTTTKDVIFAGLLILLSVSFCKIVSDANAFLLSGWEKVKFIIITLLLCLFRNNAIYAVLIGALICILSFRYKKQIAILFSVPIVLFYCVTQLLYPALGILPGLSREMYSVPLQQIACVINRHESEFTEDDKLEIEKFIKLDFDEIAGRYNPRYADGIKNEYVEEETAVFYKMWIKLLKKYPVDYIDAFLTLNCPYWYPMSEPFDPYAHKLFVETNVSYNLMPNKYPNQSKIPFLLPFYESVGDMRIMADNQYLKPLFSLCLPFWIMLVCLCNLIFRRKKIGIIVLIVPLIYWLTFMLGPVSNFRYIFCIYLLYPLLFCMLISCTKMLNK